MMRSTFSKGEAKGLVLRVLCAILFVLAGCAGPLVVPPQGWIAGRVVDYWPWFRSRCFVMDGNGDSIRWVPGILPLWSPDGAMLAYDRDGDLWVERADGRNRRRLAQGMSDFAWAPDGQRLAGAPSTGGLVIIEADGSGQTRVLEQLEQVWDVDWSQDGEWLVVDGQMEGSDGSCWLAHADGSALQALMNEGGSYGFSPDGSRMLIGRFGRDGYQQLAILVLADQSEIVLQDVRSIKGAQHAAWSPDSQYVAWDTELDDGSPFGPQLVFLTTADGARTEEVGEGISPTWLPDGNLAYYDEASAPWQIRVVTTEGTELRRLDGPDEWEINYLTWSPMQ